MVSPEPTCIYGMQQSEEGWCDGLGLSETKSLALSSSMNESQGRYTFRYYSRGGGQCYKLSWGKEEFFVVQHDEASAHYEASVRAWLDGMLEDRWMGRVETIQQPTKSQFIIHWTSGLGVT